MPNQGDDQDSIRQYKLRDGVTPLQWTMKNKLPPYFRRMRFFPPGFGSDWHNSHDGYNDQQEGTVVRDHARFDTASQSMRPMSQNKGPLTTPRRQPDLKVLDWMNWSRKLNAQHTGSNDVYLQHKRSTYGDRPEVDTSASIQLQIAPATQRAKKALHTGNINVLAQLIYWIRTGFNRSAQPTQQAIRMLLTVSLVGTIILSGLGMTIWAYADYRSLSAEVTGGISYLKKVPGDLGLNEKTQVGSITPQQIQAAQNDISRAQQKFTAAHERLSHPDIILRIAGATPIINTKVQSALALTQIAIYGGSALEQFMPAMVSITKLLKASPLADAPETNDASSLLKIEDTVLIAGAIQKAMPYFQQMVAIVQSTPSEVLGAALSGSQQNQLLPVLDYIPRIPDMMSLLNDFLPLAPTLLGMKGYPVAYLISTLDNSEIRPTGGFQGQYAVVEVNGGHVGKIALQDVYQYLEIDPTGGRGGDPLSYRALMPNSESWWEHYGLGWGLRNSGISPDFPTSARFALTQLHNEPIYFGSLTQPYLPTGNHVPLIDSKGAIVGFDPHEAKMAGFITIQSSIIAQLLNLTGPITIGCPYNTTVSANDLQTKIHYYQETADGRNTGIGAGSCPGIGNGEVKKFTILLTQQLIAQLKKLPSGSSLKLIDILLHDFQTKDLQVYFTDPDTKQVYGTTTYNDNYPPYQAGADFLQKYHISGATYTGNDDSLMVNLANVAGDKLDQYLHLQLNDTIQLGNDGTAQHNLTIIHQFDVPRITFPADASNADRENAIYSKLFNAANQHLYWEYWRVYTPSDSRFKQGSGIQPGPIYSADRYADFSGRLIDNKNPLSLGSDVTNRTVFDGVYWYAWDYLNNSNTVTFYSPLANAATTSLVWNVTSSVIANGIYTLHVQRQSGVDTQIDITIDPPACSTNKLPLHIAQVLDTDINITMNVPGC
jgi:Protein of unknown function (DUF4012)